MVREFYKEKEDNEQLVAQLTGLLAAMQSFARSLTALPWGFLSDIIGRKVPCSFITLIVKISWSQHLFSTRSPDSMDRHLQILLTGKFFMILISSRQLSEKELKLFCSPDRSVL